MNLQLTIENEHCDLKFHRQSQCGIVRDYIISFKNEESNIEVIVQKTSDIFLELMDVFKDCKIKARLVADIEFEKMIGDNDDVRYHFGSYSSEWVGDPEMFYERHMCKIISRLDNFNERGSNLILKKVNHIHIQLAILS